MMSDSKQAVDERQFAIEFLRIVNASNSTRELVRNATAFFQKQSACEAVGIRLHEGDDYPYYETRGFPQDFVETENSLCVRFENGEPQRDGGGNPVLDCMCGNVICGRIDPSKPFFTPYGSFWTNGTTELLASTSEADRQARTRNRCNGEGYESVALIPLISGSHRVGLLQLNDHRKQRFTAEGIALWERLAGYLAVAVAKSLAEEEMRESEERYHSLFDQMTEGFALHEILCDEQGEPCDYRFLDVNAAFERLTGLKRSQVIGKTMREILPGEKPDWIKTYGAVALTGQPVRFESHAVALHRDYEVFAYRPAAGRFAVIFTDVTERKPTQDALQESEERLALAASAAQVGMFDWNVLTGEVVWTPQHEVIFGYTPTTATTSMHNYRDWSDRVHPEDLPWVEEEIRRCVAAPMPYQVEYRVIWPDGSQHWVAGHGRAHFDSDGRATRMLGTVVDISERKRAVESLAAEATRRRILIEGSRDGIVVLDQHGGVFEANQKFAETLGYTSAEVLQLHVWDWDRDWPRERVLEAIQSLGPEGVRFEARHWRKDGSYLDVEMSNSAAELWGQKLVFCVCHDVTDRKRAEQERLKMERHLLQTQKLESIGVLAGGIAHDFNNILAGIMGYTDVIKRSLPASERVQADLDVIKMAVQRAANLTRQMLAYSGQGKFLVERIDLARLIVDTQKMLKVSISKKAVLEYSLSPDLPAVVGDPSQIQQVVLNLIVNASEALGNCEGRIVIAADAIWLGPAECAVIDGSGALREGRYVRLEVADTGCGMNEEVLAKIFEPFYTTKFAGRGLGLAAVHGIVRGHKGAIQASSQAGQGTIFRVYLPASDSTAPISPVELAERAWAGNGVVLVVDDEEVVRNSARRMIELIGFTALVARDGDEAVRLFAQRHREVTCVLLDLTMPKLDGEQVFHELRKIHPDVRVILSSGYGEEGATERFAGMGLAGFLQKPYQFDAMALALRNAIGER